MIKPFTQWIGLLAVLLLGACAASSEDELRQWMTAQKNEIHPQVKPIAEPKLFKPELYGMVSEMEPFSNQKLTQALRKDSAQAALNGVDCTRVGASQGTPGRIPVGYHGLGG